MTLTFTPKGEVRERILAVVAFDIGERRDVGDLARNLKRGGASSLAAVIEDSERTRREVWFGKIIERWEQSAQLMVELPGLIKPIEATTGYKLAFQPVDDGDLKWVAGATNAISQAKLTNVRLELPEGWDIVDGNWTLHRLSEADLDYIGNIANGTVIEVRFKRGISPFAEWMKINIAKFFGVLVVVFVTIVAALKKLLKSGWRWFGARAVISTFMMPLGVYVGYDFLAGGAQGWFETNWWMISAFVAFILAISLPMPLLDFFTAVAKRPDQGAMEGGET